MNHIAGIIKDQLFWVVLLQWSTLPSLFLVVQHFVVPKKGRLALQIILNLVLSIVVFTAVLLVPLLAMGYLPLPEGVSRVHYFWGAIVGGLASIPLTPFLRRRWKRSDEADYTLHAETGHFHLTGGASQATLGATYTGRHIYDVGEEYRVAKEWLDTYECSLEHRSELEQKLLESLGLAPAGAFEAPLFRGRHLTHPPASSKCFGPPRPERAKRGRYNAKGIPVLYLSTSKDGVMRECESREKGKQLWIQQFQFPVPFEFRIADARELTQNSFAAAVFWLIEQGRDPGRPPQLGARVGEIIAGKFDGLIVPGVRGESNALYCNVVVFRPEECWHKLVDENAPPEAAS